MNCETGDWSCDESKERGVKSEHCPCPLNRGNEPRSFTDLRIGGIQITELRRPLCNAVVMVLQRTPVLFTIATASACVLTLAACSSGEDRGSTARQASIAKTYEVCFENASTYGISVNTQNAEPEWLPVVPGERLCASSVPESDIPPTMKMGTYEWDLPCTLKFEQYTGNGRTSDALNICGRPNLGSKTESWRVYLPEEIEMIVTPTSSVPNLSWNLKFEDYP